VHPKRLPLFSEASSKIDGKGKKAVISRAGLQKKNLMSAAKKQRFHGSHFLNGSFFRNFRVQAKYF
jgi:hypothetical protein